MERKAFQYILYSIVIVLFLEYSECCYNDSHVSCSPLTIPVSLTCYISEYNSTKISSALKICTFGKGYHEVTVDLNLSEGSIELPLDISDNVNFITIRNVGSSPLYISILPVKKHSNLTTLSLYKTNLNISSNFLTNYFPNLEDIYFDQIYSVEMLDNFLTGLKSLSRIKWSSGSLVNISENAFEGLTSLSHIDLSYNSISYLPSIAFQNLPSLRTLDAQGNPLNCSTCGLQWMSMVDSKFNISIDGYCTDSNTRVDSVFSHSHCHSTESYQCFNKSIECENTCINTPLSYICTCDEGYGLSLKETGQACYDIDECLHDVTLCQGMKCNNTLGSYECYCEEGFHVEEGSCLDVDECSSNPCEYACNNTVGSYECVPNRFTIFTIAIISAFSFVTILLILSSICLLITCCCYFKKQKQTTAEAGLSSTPDDELYFDGSTMEQITPKKKGKQKQHTNSGDELHNGTKQPVSNLATNEEHCYVNTACSPGLESVDSKELQRKEYAHYENLENLD